MKELNFNIEYLFSELSNTDKDIEVLLNNPTEFPTDIIEQLSIKTALSYWIGKIDYKTGDYIMNQIFGFWTTNQYYFENFVLYHKNKVKIIAKNHQYLGVNNAILALQNKETNKGKLGIFWHTQGSGKSYSMIFFSKKIHRKVIGNWSFLVITDRKDLDVQIYRNFLETEAIVDRENTRDPKTQRTSRCEVSAGARQHTTPYIHTPLHIYP